MAGDVTAATSPSLAPTPDSLLHGDGWLPRVTEELNRPLSTWFCVLGWLASSGLFVALVAIFRGPSNVDIDESIYSTWAIAHGQIACAYPAARIPSSPPVAPLYPLLSGGIAAAARIGHSAPFPSTAAFGADCHDAFRSMNGWNARANATIPTTWIGCVCWLALLAGVIAWLRASGRGRCGWEPATLLVVAGLLPVWMCVQTFFHPQDLLAFGLALAAIACTRRDRWLAVGALCALAVLSQQFALLVAAPLFVVAPAAKRIRMAGAAIVTAAIVVVPLIVMTSGRALRAITLGSGDNPSEGGTVLWETHASGVAAVLLYRVAPIVVSVVLSWWVVRHLGPGAREPVPLLSLVTVSLALRLVFEANLITYYFVALTVSLVLLEATRGSIRRSVVAWLAVQTLVVGRLSGFPFGTTPWGAILQNDLLPFLLGGLAILGILMQLLHAGDRRNLLPWVAVTVVFLFTRLPDNAFSAGHVIWFWQIVLVGSGILLAAQPLYDSIRRANMAPEPHVEPSLAVGG